MEEQTDNGNGPEPTPEAIDLLLAKPTTGEELQRAIAHVVGTVRGRT